jgi:hypothetical protein
MSGSARWVSPAGFLLALLFFLLPFVAVSCDAGNEGSFELSYSGLDLATGAKPGIEANGDLGRQPTAIVDNESPPEAGVQPLALGALALLGVGLALSLLPATRGRAWVAAGLAGGAAALLVITEVVALSNLRSSVRTTLESTGGSGDVSPAEVDGVVVDLVEMRSGFWLTLCLVVLVLLFNLGLMVYRRSRAGPVG